jgi:protein-disulfide isomerase
MNRLSSAEAVPAWWRRGGRNPYVSAMKGLLAATLLLMGCHPADGGSQNAPASSSRADAQKPAVSDSVRISALLERADAGRIQGSRSAPVWLVEISDFQCPFCKRWHDQVYPAIVRDYIRPGHVRMAYVNLPLAQHENSVPAAEAALCASVQDRFWPMHDKLFATQERWATMPNVTALFDSLAASAGVNIGEWRECMRSGLMSRVVNGDRTRARTSGVRSTPTFFVGDQAIAGAAPLDTFRLAIERARAKAAGRPRP